MKQELTEIVVVMDASGSMDSIRTDAVGGFNSFIEKQKTMPEAANLTVIFFDSNRYEKWQDGVDLRDCPVLGDEYMPGASTPLLDATGRTIEELGTRLENTPESERPGQVMVIVVTDGMENSSTVFTKQKVKEMIRRQEEVYKWEFVFLAANVDAFQEGDGMGFRRPNIAGYTSSKKGIRAVYAALSDATLCHRRSEGVKGLGREIGEDE